jgi:pimeloyl-ACP methyl ester carboxylesterase
MGGAVALELALSRPELVKGLVLVSTLPSWNGPFPPSDAVKKLFGQTEMTRELLARVYDAVFGSEYKEKVSADEYVDYRLNDEYPQPLSSYLNQLGALEKFNLADSISTISARTLIVAGSEDRVVPPQNALWMAERIPRSEMEIFKGAGHMLPIEMPGRLAAKILAWTPQG